MRFAYQLLQKSTYGLKVRPILLVFLIFGILRVGCRLAHIERVCMMCQWWLQVHRLQDCRGLLWSTASTFRTAWSMWISSCFWRTVCLVGGLNILFWTNPQQMRSWKWWNFQNLHGPYPEEANTQHTLMLFPLRRWTKKRKEKQQ